ncbi:MAG TPA: hypothetical protein VNK82_03795 [Terriglobales bacterium]|nr:hypothetical protein [Terriglobales bacterium]
MDTAKEGRIWQAAGAAAVVGGAAFLVRVVLLYGMAYADPSALSLGLAASFIILAGVAAFIGGRILAAMAGGIGSRELSLWGVLALAGLISGTATVLFSYRESLRGTIPTLDDLALGLAGSFAVMVGVMVMLGQRIMKHATRR